MAKEDRKAASTLSNLESAMKALATELSSFEIEDGANELVNITSRRCTRVPGCVTTTCEKGCQKIVLET